MMHEVPGSLLVLSEALLVAEVLVPRALTVSGLLTDVNSTSAGIGDITIKIIIWNDS